MKLIHEIFDEFESTKSPIEKKQILLNNNSKTMQIILMHMFNRNIKFGYDKIPEYKPSDDPKGLSISSLYVELKKINLLYEDNVNMIGEKRAERILVRMLENVHKNDATILEKLIMRKLKVSGLTERLVRETFPKLLPPD